MSSDLLAGGMKGPSQLKNGTASVTLDAPSYPYTFSMMCSSMYEGDEATFTVQVYCTDKSAVVIDDPNFA